MKTLSSLFNRKTLVAVALGLATLGVAAQDLRIGFVNLERILRDSNSAKAAQTKLEQEFSRREKEVQGLAAQLKSASEKFEREAPDLARRPAHHAPAPTGRAGPRLPAQAA